MASKEPGFVVNKGNIAFAMALISLLGAGWKFAGSYFEIKAKDEEQDRRLDQHEKDRARDTAATEKLTDKTDKLTNAVTRLTAVIETSTLTRKAEIEIPRNLIGPSFHDGLTK